jgi:glycosyltransferase involved in cell wall biosynthesis
MLVVTIEHAGHLQTIRDTAQRLGIADNVLLTDLQTLTTLPDFLQACDVAVVPRPGAPGFPIKLLNYMAARKPCVLFASSSSGLHHGQNAFLVERDTSESLAEGIVELLKDESLRERLADGGHHFVRAHHDRRLTAARLVAAYRRAIRPVRLKDRELARTAARPAAAPHIPLLPAGFDAREAVAATT